MSRYALIVALALACLPAVAQAGCFSGGQVVLQQPPALQVQYVPQAACGQPTVLPATTGYGCSAARAIVLRQRIVNGRVVQPVLVPPFVFPRPRVGLFLGF